LFFSNIQRTFVENADTQHSRNEFWHSVAHYEYIQEWMPCSGVRPTKEMWMNAKPYFEEVVSELNPKCILFVCKRVYDRITPDFPSGELLNSDSGNRTTIKIQNAHATYVKHPTRYGFRKSREVVSKLIQISGGKSRV
jgi:hypothetical protein